ncbi:MAG: DUF3575 domain-containing protein [Mediterranea sp.]|jgi:hypothetical protein|nr:DUF3575 domain-containing protein [Mediterranea sp.]
MKHFKLLLLAAVGILVQLNGYARLSPVGQSVDTLVFRFEPDKATLDTEQPGNREQLLAFKSVIGQIAHSGFVVRIDGYGSESDGYEHNLILATTRAKVIKEMLVEQGVDEKQIEMFYHTYGILGTHDVVTLELLPVAKATPRNFFEANRLTKLPLRLRTNLLYDAFMEPTIGIEGRVTPSVGVKLDMSFSFWGCDCGPTQRSWLISPEVRWYNEVLKGTYVGVAGNFGFYDVYHMTGTLFSKRHGVNGDFWNVGVTAGYHLPLSSRFMLDFNVGLGYNHFRFDIFRVEKRYRVYGKYNHPKCFWGLMQAGVSLVYIINK